MCFLWFKKKKKDHEEIVKENNVSLKENVVKISVICQSCPFAESKAKLQKLHDKLKYSSPSSQERVAKVDNKIFKKLDDVRIAIAKNSEERVSEEVFDLELLVVERQSLFETGI